VSTPREKKSGPLHLRAQCCELSRASDEASKSKSRTSTFFFPLDLNTAPNIVRSMHELRCSKMGLVDMLRIVQSMFYPHEEQKLPSRLVPLERLHRVTRQCEQRVFECRIVLHLLIVEAINPRCCLNIVGFDVDWKTHQPASRLTGGCLLIGRIEGRHILI
jgi:hypothetical protein